MDQPEEKPRREDNGEEGEQPSAQLMRPVLRVGSSGLFVLLLQSALNDLGASLQIDGVFGRRTRSAVLAFQSSRDLAADGVVGPQTWGSLEMLTDLGAAEQESTVDLGEQDLGSRQEFYAAAYGSAGSTAGKSATPKVPGKGVPRPTQAGTSPQVDRESDQAISWFNENEPYGMKLVGAIFFATNSASLDGQDKAELDKLVDMVGSWETSPIHPGDRPLVFIAGNTDPRKTTRKGGNPKLSKDRAFAVYKYLEYRLSERVGPVWKDRIEFGRRGFGVSEGLKTFGYEFMRSALLVRMRGDKLKPGRKTTTPKAARARAREVLKKHKAKFDLPDEWRRLMHICRDSTTEDGFIKSTDPEFQKVNSKGRPSKAWPYRQLKQFVNRHNVTDYLRKGAGPSATDEEVIGVLRDIHVHADQAIFEMHRNQAEDDALPFDIPVYNENQRRKQLINWVADGIKNDKSFYYNWGPARNH
jgi:peptidoglycan hydrolase-like protein with peptidoglycan-binding domain